MKDEDILLPEISQHQINLVWKKISGWHHGDANVGERAVEDAIKALVKTQSREAVRMNQKQEQAPVSEPRAFCLEAAKRGEPLVTRDGRKARFVAHVPDALETNRFVSLVGDVVYLYGEDGLWNPSSFSALDLFLAPNPKRTVWVNVFQAKSGMLAFAYEEKKTAEERMGGIRRVIATAVPIKIDDVGGEG